MWFWLALGFLVIGVAAAAIQPMKVCRRPGLEKEFDKLATSAYNQMGGWPVFTIERRLALRKLSQCQPRGTLLDAGCGPGYLLNDIHRRFPELEIIGLDLSPDMLEIASKHLRDGSASLICADVAKIPLNDESLDFVISTGTLHHWMEAREALNEIYRVLKPGGQLFIMDLRRDCPRVFFVLIYLIQRIMAPAIRRVNGPVGSYWASYTVMEMRCLISGAHYLEWSVNSGLGWLYAWGIK